MGREDVPVHLAAVVSAEQMKRYDSNTIKEIGIPAAVLMERAALAVVDEVNAYRETKAKASRVLVVSGCGNNGGDGFAIARILQERGWNVESVLIGDEKRCSELTALQINILRHLGVDILRNFEEQEYDIIIDALFGIGLTREVQGEYAEAIRKINAADAYKISVDIPSGIGTDDGKVYGCAVKADKTVTFGFLKKGLCFYPGKAYAGEVICAGIGITSKSFCKDEPDTFTCQHKQECILPERVPQGNKGTFGKVLMVAGSKDMAGAAVLCAKAAYRTGAGMVKVVTCEENREILQKSVPEALLLTYSDDSVEQSSWQREWETSLTWADVYVIGCGCGQKEKISWMLKKLLEVPGKPIVLDADALNLISKEPCLAAEVVKQENIKILTPHPGELARLLHLPIAEVCEDLWQAVTEAVNRYQCVVAGKDATTIVSAPGEKIYLNRSGNSGMATAGSGDVLAGVIGGLLAQKEPAYEATWKGVYLHGLAGDMAAEKNGEYAVMASDIVESLPQVIKVCLEENNGN